MRTSDTTLDDHELSHQLAERAGRLLLDLRTDLAARGASMWHLKDAGDEAAHVWLAHEMAIARPRDGFLSEEGRDDRSRLEKERVWIIDPLDGTREYGEGRADWAVHVALAENGIPIAGAVALPAEGVTLSTAHPPTLPPFPTDRPLRIVVSRSRPPFEAIAVARHLAAEMVEMGSAGAKAMAVVRGQVEMYVHAGGQYEWDNCAPAVVAMAAGLHVSRVDGSPLRYNQRDPYLPDVVICRREIADEVLSVLTRH